MTTKVHIKNYQSVKDVSFDFEGFTVILGKNNIGKSAIVRAIEAPLVNQPGKDFIRHGEKNTTVHIVKDDVDLKWIKGSSAVYEIKNGDKVDTYTKLNRDVPQPLIDAGFEKMKIGDKRVLPLIASQFDALFLVDKPGSVVTEVLAELYQIDTISKADDLCQRALKSQKSLLKTRESDLNSVEVKLEVFSDFENIKETVANLLIKEKESENLTAEINTLKEFEDKLNTLAKSLGVLRTITTISIPEYTECEIILNDIEWLRKKEEKLSELTNNVERLKGISKIEVPEATKVDSLIKEAQDIKWLQENEEKYSHLTKNVLQLKGISKIEVPDISQIEALKKEADEIKWLQDKEVTLTNLTDQVKKLKGIAKVDFPDISETGILVKEVELLKGWNHAVSELVMSIKAQKDFLDNFDVSKISKLATEVSSRVEELKGIKILEQSFSSTSQAVKGAEKDLKITEDNIKKLKEEMAEMKVCPLCERPL